MTGGTSVTIDAYAFAEGFVAAEFASALSPSPTHGITVRAVVPDTQCQVAAVMQRCAQPQTRRLVAGLRVDDVHLAVAAPGDGDPVGAR